MNNTLKELNSFAYDLVIEYSKLCCDEYSISINDIPICDLNKLCSLFIKNDLNFCNEILGFDNEMYEKKVLKYLISHLNDSNNQDKKENFLEIMQESIRNYLHHNMIAILDEQLENFIYHTKYDVA